MAVYLVLSVILTAAVVTDMNSMTISNRLIAVGLGGGFLFRIWTEGPAGVPVFIVHVSVPVILLYLLFQIRALGAGDIKLFSVIGAYVTFSQLCSVLVGSFVAGALLGSGKLLYKYLVKKEARGTSTRIHFSVAIYIAYVCNVWRWLVG